MHLLFQDPSTLDLFYLNKLHPCVSFLGTDPTLWKPEVLGPLKAKAPSVAQASSGASGCLTTSPAAPLALSIRLPKSGWVSLVALLLDGSKDKLTELCLLWILLLIIMETNGNGGRNLRNNILWKTITHVPEFSSSQSHGGEFSSSQPLCQEALESMLNFWSRLSFLRTFVAHWGFSLFTWRPGYAVKVHP